MTEEFDYQSLEGKTVSVPIKLLVDIWCEQYYGVGGEFGISEEIAQWNLNQVVDLLASVGSLPVPVPSHPCTSTPVVSQNAPDLEDKGGVTPSMEESLRIQLAILRRERNALEMVIADRDIEIQGLRDGIKRLSAEEELLAETTDGEAYSLVSLAAKLDATEKERAEQWRLRRDAEGSRDAARAAADSLRMDRDQLRVALEPFAKLYAEIPEDNFWPSEEYKNLGVAARSYAASFELEATP